MERVEKLKKLVKEEALNCVENLVVRDEISLETYELLSRVIAILSSNNTYDLGDGLLLKLVDCKNS